MFSEVEIFPGDGKRILNFVNIILFDHYKIKNLKVLPGQRGKLFVTGPARSEKEHCTHCGQMNILSANYCNRCGGHLISKPEEYHDIFHPIDPLGRTLLETAIFAKLFNINNKEAI